MKIPDIAGFTLKNAREQLVNAGIRIISVELTYPPKHKITEYEDDFRVIRVQPVENDGVKLLICKPL